MTRRTLTRRLAQEGTSYSELLKEARYQTALHYLQHSRHSVEDIAFLVGFSECGPFARAFKRWSGVSPADYRRARTRPARQG
jgi:AraC-like DNA-binding protein